MSAVSAAPRSEVYPMPSRHMKDARAIVASPGGSMLAAVLLVLAASLASGCAVTGNDLVGSGIVSAIPVDSRGMAVSDLRVYARDDGAMVTGRITDRRGPLNLRDGHVDVAVLSPGGRATHLVSARMWSRMSIAGEEELDQWQFWAELPASPDSGSLVRVTYHSANAATGQLVSCADNQARYE